MNGGAADGDEIFTGSRGSAHLVEWIDQLLLDLRDGRVNDARAALETEAWRGLDLSGIPQPILNQLADSLDHAAEALAVPSGSVEAAEDALLVARSRFLPGG